MVFSCNRRTDKKGVFFNMYQFSMGAIRKFRNSPILGKLHLRSISKYRASKKMSFHGKIAITTHNQNAKVGGVLENSGYSLPDGH